MPYLTEASRDNVRSVIEEAGSRATADAPLAWLAMEPVGEQAEVHLTMWPDGEHRLIARAGLHGRDVTVLPLALQSGGRAAAFQGERQWRDD
jgi:hypothetical protein